jgi:glycerophosphoryl diester phosphodiesterase
MARRPLLLGHRGARKDAPENTLPAFQLALSHGCDGFEFDVRLTSDGEAVICHDEKYEGLVVARTTHDALAGRWPPDAGLATLEDALAKFSETAFLNVELKVNGSEEPAMELLNRYPPKRGCVVSSFLPPVLEELAKRGVKQPLGLICDAHRQLERWKELPIAAVMLQRILASRSLIDEIHTAGKQVFVWTVNSANEMQAFRDVGVDGIISDDTRLLAETLGEVV